MTLGVAAMVADEDEIAARHLERAADEFGAFGSLGLRGTCLVYLARALYSLGRYDELERVCNEAERLTQQVAGFGTVDSAEGLSQMRALVRVPRGEYIEGERLARMAVELAARTEAPLTQGDAYFDLAQVLEATGEPDEAAAAFEEALARYERKQIIPLARRTRERLAVLG